MRRSILAATGLCLVLNAAGAGAASEVARAVTLAGEEIEAPNDLAASSLLVANFHRNANAGLREWRLLLEDDPRAEGSSVYTLVVLEGAPGFIRRMVIRSLRGDVAAERHHAFLVVEEGADPWRELVGSSGEGEDLADAVFVIRLVNGEVCGRHQGLVSEAAVADLLDASCED